MVTVIWLLFRFAIQAWSIFVTPEERIEYSRSFRSDFDNISVVL